MRDYRIRLPPWVTTQTHERIGMADARGRQPSGDETPEPACGDAVTLTAPPQHAPPGPPDSEPKGVQRRTVHGHAVVADVTRHDRAQVRPLLRDGVVQASPKLG